MNLSKRLTFSIFSILFVAVLFVAPNAMAQVTVTAYTTTTAATTTAGEKIVITLTYSEAPTPRPDFSHFTTADNAISHPDDTDSDRDVLAASYNDGTNAISVALGGTGKTITLTFTGPAGDGTSVGADIALPSGLQLRGYGGTGASPVDITDVTESTKALIDDGTNAPTPLGLSVNYIGGKTYVVYVRGTNATTPTTLPHLPAGIAGATIAAGSQVIRTIFADGTSANSNMAMPDLEDFFWVGGGTIDLNVEDTAKDSRHLIINEVMWAVDNRLIGETGRTDQQWIEVYNRLATPAPSPTFVFTNNPSGLNPPDATEKGTSDRLSNIPSYVSAWNVKGQNGTSKLSEANDPTIIGADPVFKSMYRKTDKQNADGTNAGHWEVSTRPYRNGFYGSPGSVNVRGVLPSVRKPTTRFTPPKNSVVINELYNADDKKNDWLEIRAIADTNLENWTLSKVTALDTETEICRFPKQTIRAGEVWLIVNTELGESTNLAPGMQIGVERENQVRGAGSHKYLKIDNFEIPEDNDGNYLLVLRTAKGWERWKSRDRMHDVVGPARFAHKTRNQADGKIEPHSGDQYWETEIWPINGWTGLKAHNAGDSNNSNAYLQPDRKLAKGKAWVRNGTNNGFLKDGISGVGYKGGLGYGRNIGTDKALGTPGYDNGIVKGKTTDLGADRALYISELMLTTDRGRYPQWIELYNNSDVAIDLAADGTDPKDGWHLIIENHDSGTWASKDRPVYVDIKLKELFTGDSRMIPPRETVLIVSDKGRNSKTEYFPSHRVASIWERKRSDFKMATRRDMFLNAAGGFYIKIVDGDGNVSDEVGNLDGIKSDARRGVNIDMPVGFMWPTNMTAEGYRSSLIRLRHGGTPGIASGARGMPGTPRVAVPTRDDDGNATDDAGAVIPMGVRWRGAGAVGSTGTQMLTFAKYDKHAWVHAVDAKMAFTQDTWYGASTDHGTPLHIGGTPLPVSLSYFRPTLEDSEVVIRWTTESELDNAGFNIYRSESRDGEFKQVNAELIQGKGTTGERSTYKWVDTSAKPDAVYFYQIEDVSFAGERQTLATTKLKGLISAKGKLTTTWGNIKEASQ